MAAAALEQSMLESKDKDTLLEMAKALGVKVTARQKKSDIIDKILDTTGSGAGAPDGETPSPAPADREPAASTPEETAKVEPAAENGAGSTDVPEVVLGPDGEPLADWEIELTRNGGGGDATDAGEAGEASAPDTSRGERSRGEQPRG